VRLYLDQCLRSELAGLLRSRGHDVVRAAETGQARADDALVLERAIREERTLVTLDEHFGDWVVLLLTQLLTLFAKLPKAWQESWELPSRWPVPGDRIPAPTR
jgi:predicted nuclease of predicted toxin-antitoxin system